MCYEVSLQCMSVNLLHTVCFLSIVDMLLTVQHHLPCMSRYSTMPLTVTIFKFLNVINLFQCDASDILKHILTFVE
jgi:hypothetical protein